ncbi:MAG TPA: DUF669 domain-containing protein [Pirellulales bacterium]|nr:DUF669 domain-containing protein [Pirellulales bacterium]
MGKLSDILSGGGNFFDGWSDIPPADEFGPVPSGIYVARIRRAKLEKCKKKGTPSYSIEFEVVEGAHVGRHIWHPIWLTPDARRQARRDLDKLGITDPATQLEQPLREGIICEFDVTLRTADNGAAYNEVRRFTVIRIDEPPAEPFAPNAETEGNGP